jgi:predicted ester cyclase
MPEFPPILAAYIAGLKKHDVDAIAKTVSDDLAFITPARTLTRDQFLEMLRALYAAFPDWRYDNEPPEQRDDVVAVKWRQSGTHTGTFALPGIAPVRPTGKHVRIPEQHFFYTIRNGKIVQIRPDPVRGGAPGGILDQIGARSHPL